MEYVEKQTIFFENQRYFHIVVHKLSAGKLRLQKDQRYQMMKHTHPIDFVIPWVNGSDPAWLAERAGYREEKVDAGAARFRDWGVLHYWFRSVEKFAPWVNKIHFITCGHLPDWLNTAHPKLHIVNHRNYIPEKYLPVFSSHPIELNIHRIKELAEHFVYFNDDTFILKPVKTTDFFRNGLPCDTAVLGPANLSYPDDRIPLPENVFSIGFNDIMVINHRFNKKEVLRKHWPKFFSLKYGKIGISSLLQLPYRQIYGFYIHHLPSAFRKSMFEKVWQENPEILDNTCQNKFRKFTDVNQWLIQYYQFCTGNFMPVSPNRGKCFDLCKESPEALRAIVKQKYKMICCNDSAVVDFEVVSRQLHNAFDRILPEKCAFEK